MPREGCASILWPSFSAMGRLCFKIVTFFQCHGKAVLQDCGHLSVPREGYASRIWSSFSASGRLLESCGLLSVPWEGSASRLWPSLSAMGRLCFKIVAIFQCLGKAVLQRLWPSFCAMGRLLQYCGLLSVPGEGSASKLWPSFSAMGRLCFKIVVFFHFLGKALLQ